MKYLFSFVVITYITLIIFLDQYFPPPWPDEVLFSSAAYQLANYKKFTTEVLSGIVFGMDQATLWMSPLYMVFLSFLYVFIGEFLWVGRSLSLFFGILTLYIFYKIIKSVIKDEKIAIIFSFFLGIELSFLRAGNIIRMESLNLLFSLLTVYFLERKNFSLSGMFIGLSALTHPISVFLVPITFLYTYRWRDLVKIALIVILIMFPWLIYVAFHWDVFVIQFFSQFARKTAHYDFQSFLYFVKVLGGQYQTKINFIAFYILILAGMVLFIWDVFRDKQVIKYFLIFLFVFLVVFFGREMWYVVYIVPFLLIFFINFIKYYQSFRTYLMIFLFFLFGFIQFHFWYKHLSKYQAYKKEYVEYISLLKNHTQNCQMVFLQAIPDPYFDLPKDKIYKEFAPFGILKYSTGEHIAKRKKTYESIDCFVISEKIPSEPILEEYLQKNKANFTIMSITGFQTIPSVFVYLKH
ncbi:MAG: hypothetical protein NZ853_10305 [Leptospiraceae bacterium]|nr:hypothetical protein [Leptospiraceae bacterium]MDW7974951.1 hypothetical protein [Leptospiraceae bacterium]